MNFEMIPIIGIPLVTFGVTGLIAFKLGQHRQKFITAVVVATLIGFTALMYFGMETASGWDGLGYLFALLGLCAPGAAGTLIGGLIGWLRDAKETHA